MAMLNGYEIVGREIKVYEAYLSNIGRWMSEKFIAIIGTVESVAWLVLAFSVITFITYIVVRCREIRNSDLPAKV